MKEKNAGYTLVELLVVIAILAIVGIGIGTMISQALKTYRIAHAEVRLQEESQLAGNQLMNLIIDANGGVGMESGKLNIYSYDEGKSLWSKTVIAYDSAEEKITYSRYEADSLGSEWIAAAGEIGMCMAEYVTDFSVTLLDENGTRLIVTGDCGDYRVRQVKIHIVYGLEDKSYDFEETVTLRNQVLAGSLAGV